jgi:hypothetical protein
LPRILLAAVFWFLGLLLVRCIREPRYVRLPNGFQVASMSASGRTSLDQEEAKDDMGVVSEEKRGQLSVFRID